MEQVTLVGVRINHIPLSRLLDVFVGSVERDNKIIISYVNIHALNIAYDTPWFRMFLNQSYLTFCDGIGIKLAARLTGQQLSFRFTPPDFMHHICEIAARSGWRIFFLGAKPGVAQRAADRLMDRFPGLQIKTHHGYFDKIPDGQENRMVVEQINQFHPHILVLGFGMPLQEKWILENLPSLKVNIAFPAGALFDYLSGELPRAPRWMTDNGLEWLGRLLIEPRRLWKRYILGNPLFFFRLFVHHFLDIRLPE